MPLFFIISGMFAASAIARPLKRVFRNRVANLYYLYAVWLSIQTLAFSIFPLDTIRADSPVKFVALLLLGVSTLWYLYALVIYFAIAKFAQRFAGWALALSGVLSAVIAAIDIPSVGNSTSMIQNLVFFLVGAYYPAMLKRLALGVTLARSVGVVALFIVASAFVMKLSAQRVPLVTPVLSVVGVLTGVCLAVLLTRWRIHSYISWLGTVTLAVYVLHPILLALWNASAKAVGLSFSGALGYVYPVAVAGFVIAGCLGIRWLIKKFGLSWLLEMPRLSELIPLRKCSKP